MISIIEKAMAEHQRKAWDSLARYKFYMFGYHAAAWVTLKKLLPRAVQNPGNPWRGLVVMAQRMFESAGATPAESFPQSDDEQQERDGRLADALDRSTEVGQPILDLPKLVPQLAASLRQFQRDKDGHEIDCPSQVIGFASNHCTGKCQDLRDALAAYDEDEGKAG